jgi:hypothetical protein
MKNVSDGTQRVRRKPLFGVLSLILPLVGISLAYMISLSTSKGGEGWGQLFVVVAIGGLSVLLGIISALVGLARAERLIFLSVLGLLFNGYHLLWLLTH